MALGQRRKAARQPVWAIRGCHVPARRRGDGLERNKYCCASEGCLQERGREPPREPGCGLGGTYKKEAKKKKENQQNKLMNPNEVCWKPGAVSGGRKELDS